MAAKGSVGLWLATAICLKVLCNSVVTSPRASPLAVATSRVDKGRQLTFEPPVLIGYSGDGVPGWDDSCASYVALDADSYVGMVQSGGANKPGHRVPMAHPAPLVFSGDGGLSWTDRADGVNTARWAQCGNTSYCLPVHGAFALAPSRTPHVLHTWGALRPRYDSRDNGAVSFFAPTSTEFAPRTSRCG